MTDVFLESAARIRLIVIASSIAFVAVCFPVGFALIGSNSNFLIPAFLSGTVAVIVVLAIIGRRMFPPKD